MAEGLRILVVGDDAEHDLSAITHEYVARGYTPRILRMTEAEWQLADLEKYESFTALQYGTLHGSERVLVEHAFFRIAPGSQYLFQLYPAYTELCSSADSGGFGQIVARSIVSGYLHSNDNPLVAVVLAEAMWDWHEVNDTWIKDLPPETVVWVMHPGGKLEIVRLASE